MDMSRRVGINPSELPTQSDCSSVLSRRSVMVVLPCLLIGGLGPMAALASEEAATRTVTRMLTDLASLYEKTNDRGDIADGLEVIFGKYTDPAFISRSVIGVPWRKASEDQRSEFTSVFTRYLAEKYARHLPTSLRGQFDIVKVVELKKNQYSVESHVSLEGSRPYSLRWHVIRNGRETRVVNLVTNDFNLVNLERSVIRSLLNQRRGDMDSLIAYLPTRYTEK